ncbi:putative dehydrogenase [Methanolinea mesophila]|uniref:Gfo/Idh/MocA family protein n=1 Tax=Methanolinea mesophila TaxID=547055 RepID=UPI001AE72BC2|nr:Gfo/Idh/MocA family oxidoreductase [Methanolinea mesophila]MBP1928358.1 putative dehydrogenase [Methanolinea mesophila]
MDVGVIGVGVMGKNHVRVYSELRPVSGLYVYDVNYQAATAVGMENGATPCSSIEELVKNVEAVSICVPTQFHLEVARTVLPKNIHVLMEKPICATTKETEALLPLIGKGTTFGVGHIERFNPIVPEVRRICKDPLYVEMNRHNPASYRVTGASVVEDLMIHDIDILRHVLFSDGFDLTPGGTEDVATALFRFGKTPAFLSASRKSSKKIRRIYIEEEELTIEGDFMNQEIFSYWKPETYHVENERYVQENIIEKVMVNKVEPLKVELKTFLECAKDGKEFPVTALQAYEDLRICESIKAGLS